MADEKVWVSEFTVPPDDRDGCAGIKFEDGGQAAIMYSPVEDVEALVGEDDCFFVRLHSCDESNFKNKHQMFRKLMGKKVRVTIEIIDEDGERHGEANCDCSEGEDGR